MSLSAQYWRLADAKNRLSELVNRVFSEGPQFIRRNREQVVVISLEDFEKLIGKKTSLVDYLMSGPSLDGLEIERQVSMGREIEF
jgi:prevent-host-death family protein